MNEKNLKMLIGTIIANMLNEKNYCGDDWVGIDGVFPYLYRKNGNIKMLEKNYCGGYKIKFENFGDGDVVAIVYNKNSRIFSTIFTREDAHVSVSKLNNWRFYSVRYFGGEYKKNLFAIENTLKKFGIKNLF